MKLAQPIEGGWQIGEHTELFPNTSFPTSGPGPEFIEENGCLRVVDWLPHDPATQQLDFVQPVLEGEVVRIVQVVPIPETELFERQRQETLNSTLSGHPTLRALKLMTNAEFDQWFDANTQTLAAMRAVLRVVVKLVIHKLF